MMTNTFLVSGSASILEHHATNKVLLYIFVHPALGPRVQLLFESAV